MGREDDVETVAPCNAVDDRDAAAEWSAECS